MQIDLNRFRDTFFQEAEEHLLHMETDLLRLEQGENDPELLDAIFRSAHSIKGASGTFGFEDLAHFTHALENLLDALREGKIEPAPVANLLMQSLDALKDLVEAAREGGPAPANTEELTRQLVAAQSGVANAIGANPASAAVATKSEPSSGQPKSWRIRFVPCPTTFQQGMDPVLVLRELSQAGEVLESGADKTRIPSLFELDPEICYVAWNLVLKTAKSLEELRDVFAFVEDGAEISIEPADKPAAVNREAAVSEHTSRAHREPASVRVSTDKVDKLVDLVGELVIAQSMASQILENFSLAALPRLREAFGELERNTRELQERVMGIRMIPVGSVFSRFPRLVRDLANSTGKQIRLELSGEETELDKSVVESLSDPLMHVIRNSADHGIEPPEDRRAKGKAEQGVIRLHTYHQGGNVMVEVTDDGRGLDAQKIRAKAVSRGMIAQDAQLSEAEIYQLIFAPGFSTAEKVTDISGRGVGMDVVRRNIEALNGDVTIASPPGSGTSVRLRLPLTLAIIDGLLIKVGHQIFVLPLTSVVTSIRPTKSQINGLAGTGEVVVVRGEPLPLVRLHKRFNIATEITDPTCGLIVIVEVQGRPLALLVDELLGQQQVVVKSLETNFRKVDGIIGATILGDGHAALIIDVGQLAQQDRAAALTA